MSKYRRKMLLALMPLALPVGSGCIAAEIFKWVDDDGVVHFSQWAPDNGAAEATKLHIVDRNAEDYDPVADQYSIRNQAKRTGDVWVGVKERRDAAAEERRKRAEEQRRLEQQYRYYQPEPYYVHSIYRPRYPVYPTPFPHRKYGRHKGTKRHEGGHGRGPERYRRAPVPPIARPVPARSPSSLGHGQRFVAPMRPASRSPGLPGRPPAAFR